MFCPHCGSSVPDNSKFCPDCGGSLSQQGGYQQDGYPQAGYQQNTNQQDTYGTPVPPQQTNQSYDQPAASGPVRTDRDIVMYALLTIVTCGIYGYWYVYEMTRDANTICYNDGDETPDFIVYLLLSLVTCGIYNYYWMYKLANRLQANGPRYGVSIQEGGSDVLLWLILGLFTCSICSFIGFNIIIKNMNALATAYNRAQGYQ